jgi:hypothetical protein
MTMVAIEIAQRIHGSVTTFAIMLHRHRIEQGRAHDEDPQDGSH